MRKFLIPLMAASMLAPVAAQAQDDGFVRGLRNQAERSSQRNDSSEDRASRAQETERSRPERPARAERAPREDRAMPSERAGRAEREARPVEQVQAGEAASTVQRTERRSGGLAGGFSHAGQDMRAGRTSDRDNDRDSPSGRDGRRDGDRDWRGDRDGRRDGDRDWRGDRDGRRDGDRDWRGDRDGRQRWDRDWRRDGRYDWSSYRNQYRSVFRLGRYYDPYGWGYRRFTIGLNLWPSYYGSSFWLNDPWQYRLPPAYGPYRWVRYYDDAVLVNIYTGQVVDVIYNVFW